MNTKETNSQKTPKLDLKDKKLIYHLSLNSRQSNTQLAKKVHLSKNSIKYRIERLTKLGIIKQFSAVINLGSVKCDTFTMLLKFNEDIYKNPKILNFLKNYPYADWIAILSGDWDIFIEFAAKDLEHMKNIVSEIQKEFGKNLNSYQLFFSRDTVKVEHLIEDFYKNLNFEQIPLHTREFKQLELDKKDKILLNLLAENSSLDFIQISKKTNLSLDTIRYRIKKLVENGIIIKFFPEISLSKLGYTEYLYTLKLKNISQETLKKLKQELKQNTNITYCFYDFSSSSFTFVCAFPSNDQIDNLTRKLRNEYFNIIESQNYLIIKDQILFNLFPKGLIE